MTKSTITRGRAQQIFLGNGPEPSASEERELARMALAAMDSEPVEMPLDYLQGHKDGLEWAAQLAEANHPETGDWLYDDPIELAKAIRKGPDMPPAQSVDSEPVAWISQSNLDALSRGHDAMVKSTDNVVQPVPLFRHARPEPGCQHQWRHGGANKLQNQKQCIKCGRVELDAQPAPVVPDDVLDALQKVARIRLDMNDFDGDRRGIADCLSDAEEALIEVVNRRAATLQAGNSPAIADV